ncbi:MAG: mechanosensitive ion channel family protein [Proteobacteria bacterium]|nr:mechanosensitive ion channel family protein [Pseudomonadota bacterium]
MTTNAATAAFAAATAVPAATAAGATSSASPASPASPASFGFELQSAARTAHEMADGLMAALPKVAIALLVFGLFWAGARAGSAALGALLERTQQPRNVVIVLSRLLRWLLLLFGLMVALSLVVPSITASSVLGALGVGGVAVGFAFKDIFQNLLAGLLILITRPFQIGDLIVSSADEGVVEDIQVRATLLRTADNRLVVIPNSDLYTNRVQVIQARQSRRVTLMLPLAGDEPLADTKALALRVLGECAHVQATPEPQVLVNALSAFGAGAQLQVRFWVGPPGHGDVAAATDEFYSRLRLAQAQAQAQTAAEAEAPPPPR